MKNKYILLLLLSLLFSPMKALCQNSFAPIGAEWWHSSIMNVGWAFEQINCSFHTRSISDTVIDGIACRKVITEVNYVANPAGEAYRPDPQTYFFNDNTDTVFVYNKNFNRFTPIYVFNAHAGDTVCLPVPPDRFPDLRINPISGDTSFCFVIDSIRLETYGNAQFRTYYTTSLAEIGNGPESMAFPAYRWGSVNNPQGDVGGDGPSTRGKYTEHIIGVLFPRRILACADCPYFPYAPYGKIRCYSDSLYDLNLDGSACDTLYPLGIAKLQSANAILKLYPNPAGNTFDIALNQAATEDIRVTITDITGRIVQQTTLPRKDRHKTVLTGQWADGLYFLRFGMGDQLYYDKITIRH